MKITGFTGWLVEREPGPKFIWRDHGGLQIARVR